MGRTHSGFRIEQGDKDRFTKDFSYAAKSEPFLQRYKDNFALGTMHESPSSISGAVKPKHLLNEFGAGAGDALRGIRHIIDPVTPLTAEQIAEQGSRQISQFGHDPVGSYASQFGEMVPGAIAGETVSRVFNRGLELKDYTLKKLASKTGTTPADVGKFVSKTASENAAEEAAATKKTASNKERVSSLNQQRREAYESRKKTVEDQNAARIAQHKAKVDENAKKLASDRTAWAEKEHAVRQAERTAQGVEAKKQVINRAQKEYARLGLENLQKTRDAARTSLDARWNGLRSKMEKPSITDKGIDMRPVKQKPIADAIEDARSKYLVGSPDDLKMFNDLMGRIETGPLADTATGVKPMPQNLSWQEARTHFTNIGDKMYGSNLPGNVWKALQEVHGALDTQLKEAATSRGLGGEYSGLKNDWSQYKKDFDDLSSMSTAGGSPLARVVHAQVPADLEAQLNGKYGDVLLQQAAKYRSKGSNPAILDRYRQLGRTSESLAAPKIPQHPARVKAGAEPNAPEMKPLPNAKQELKAKTVKPNKKVLTPESVMQMKADKVLDNADKIKGTSGHVATFIAVLDGLRGVLAGNPAEIGIDVAGRLGYSKGKDLYAGVLAHPSVVNALSNLTPEDVQQVMRLPEDQRRGFTELAKQAQTRGIKIPPAAGALLGIAATAKQPLSYQQVVDKMQGANQ
jgi:hypothetical protein